MSHYGHIRDETQRRLLVGASREFSEKLRAEPQQGEKAAAWRLYDRHQAGEKLRPYLLRFMRDALERELDRIESHERQLEEVARQQAAKQAEFEAQRKGTA